MIKIPTLYKKDPNDLGLVISEINPGCEWVFTSEDWVATRKFDGTACAVIDGLLYKRYDVKKGRKVPVNAIPCQEPDLITGHWPHWVLIDYLNPEDKYFCEALRNQAPLPNGTYELCGPKVQGNPERFDEHTLVKHGDFAMFPPLDFDGLREYLDSHDIEGIVFHHNDGRMCKIRKSDFNLKR